MEQCRICGAESTYFDEALMLKKYRAQYFRCQNCGFIQTEKPYWLDEAYSDAIVDSDIGLIERNIMLSRLTAAVISFCFPTATSFLDYAGGYGILVRLMRDRGFHFEWFDRYCENMFAKSFRKSKDRYDVLTAFELFEHLPTPVEEVNVLSKISDNILFTTTIVPRTIPKVDDWWYYAPYNGQHVSFYTVESLQLLAKSFDYHYVGYRDIHLFSKQPVSQWKFSVAVRLSSWINRFTSRKSLLGEDYRALTGSDI
ncbi:class I SAM-dependent methyltransferase [Selenomonas flueggei]|uniref:Methyltransferase domain protein n=1 Tax=Selenomonas flueggei ATCC 43531 TaxID=638302 RepID=C4V629_9FIRM|nr:class I SAM-dependent methyltransferase [Selenomonas flueggei]EEQ47627.1 hypothetical protein HMPREF0908_1929 [Selenomonas flueggei ATCC 43531]